MLWYTTPLWSMDTLTEGGFERSTPEDLSPRLLVITGREPGKSVSIPPGRHLMGRDDNCAIRLIDPSVSRHHAVIEREPEGPVSIENLSETNGTHVNDDQVQKVVLNNGDIVRIGGVVLKYLEPGTMEAELFERVYRLAIQDSLTETLSKSAVMHHLEALILDEAEPLAIVLMDLDHFKAINDTFGHVAGDIVLSHVARILREQATRPGALVGRFGGEEFLIVMPKTTADDASAWAETLRAVIEATPVCDDGLADPISVTASFGVAQWSPALGTDDITTRALLEAADKALYNAKHEGRNAVRNGGEAVRE